MFGHGNPRLRVILENGIEADPKLPQVHYSIQRLRIKENRKVRAGKGNSSCWLFRRLDFAQQNWDKVIGQTCFRYSLWAIG